MPEYAMWTLIVSLVIFAFGLALTVAELRHRLKVSENEPNRLRSEIEMLKKRHNKEISDIEELNEKEIEKIKKNLIILRIMILTSQNIKTTLV